MRRGGRQTEWVRGSEREKRVIGVRERKRGKRKKIARD